MGRGGVLGVVFEGTVDKTKKYYFGWTVIAEEDWLNTSACSPGAFLQHFVSKIKLIVFSLQD